MRNPLRGGIVSGTDLPAIGRNLPSTARSFSAFVALCFLTGGLALSRPEQVAAYNELGCQFGTADLKWKDATTREGYATPAAAAASAWQATPTPVFMTKVTSGANIQINDGNFGDPTFNGVTVVPACNANGYWTATVVSWFNRAALDSRTSAARKNTMVHELGHALGLDETYVADCPSMAIMYSNDDSFVVCGFTTPRQDDIDGINFLY